jgi:hypothetical protein
LYRGDGRADDYPSESHKDNLEGNNLGMLKKPSRKITHPLYSCTAPPLLTRSLGIAEVGTHWWATYHNHYIKKLQMVTSSYDPYLLISSSENNEFAIIGI